MHLHSADKPICTSEQDRGSWQEWTTRVPC